MGATPYPLPTSTRQTANLLGNGGVKYGPFGTGWGIFDLQDVLVEKRTVGTTVFLPVVCVIEKVNIAAVYDNFYITFPAAITNITEFRVTGQRLHKRELAVTRGGGIDGKQLEAELSKVAAVLQEQRRDITSLGQSVEGTGAVAATAAAAVATAASTSAAASAAVFSASLAIWVGNAGGTANAVTVSHASFAGLIAYPDGMEVHYRVTVANGAGIMQLAALPLATKALLDDTGQNFIGGEFLIGDIGVAIYSTANNGWRAKGKTSFGAAGVTLIDAGAAEGPAYVLDRNSASPAANDILGAVVFQGRSDTAVKRIFASIRAVIIDAVNATEDGLLALRTVVAGVLGDRFFIAGGLFSATATGGDKGADTINAQKFYKDGVEVSILPNVILQEQKAAGINAGTSLTGVNTRALNTVVRNDGGIVTGVLPQFILQVGTYLVQWSAPSLEAASNRTYLYNVTDAVVALLGSSEISGVGADYAQTRSFGHDVLVVVAAPKTFELRHYIASPLGNRGLGISSASGFVEIYSELKIWKVA